MPDQDDDLEWLAGELRTALAFLERLPRALPDGETTAPLYAAGLHDMADWILQMIGHEQSWQGLRAFLGKHAPALLPRHSSKLEIKRKERPANGREG